MWMTIYIYIYIYINYIEKISLKSNKRFLSSTEYRLIGLVGCVLTNGPETGVQYQVDSYQNLKKWYLIPPCLTLNNLMYESRVKWSNPWKGVAESPTHRCCSYRKKSLRVNLDDSRQLYLLIYIYIYIYIRGSLDKFPDIFYYGHFY